MAIAKHLEEVTSADANEVIYKLDSPRTRSLSGDQMIWITLDDANSGTVQVAVDESTTGKKAWPAGSKIPLTCPLNTEVLRVKTSVGGQKWTPSW